jgi:DTW domain-containing protein YfiP
VKFLLSENPMVHLELKFDARFKIYCFLSSKQFCTHEMMSWILSLFGDTKEESGTWDPQHVGQCAKEG